MCVCVCSLVCKREVPRTKCVREREREERVHVHLPVYVFGVFVRVSSPHLHIWTGTYLCVCVCLCVECMCVCVCIVTPRSHPLLPWDRIILPNTYTVRNHEDSATRRDSGTNRIPKSRGYWEPMDYRRKRIPEPKGFWNDWWSLEFQNEGIL